MNKLKKYQRGNIVVGVGLPPTSMPPVAGGPGEGPGWSLIEEWDVGDLSFIEGAGGFNGAPCGDSLAWSLDGTRITLSSTDNSQDNIQTFQCSTAFDPSTAISRVSIQSKLNPNNGVFNIAGGKYFCIHTVGDEIAAFGATQFAVNNEAGELSDIDKSELGFTSSTDGSFCINPAGDVLFWRGRNGGHRWVTGTIPGGDLDSFSQLVSVAAPDTTSTQGLAMNKAEDLIVKCLGSAGVSFYTFDNLQTLGSAADGASQSLAALTAIDMRPDHVWFNPNDTSEIWFADEETGGVQLSRFATNVPTF